MRASAIIAPDRTARNMFTRPSDSWYVSARVASRDQCSVARICSFADASGSRGGISVTGQIPRQLRQRRESLAREVGRNPVVDLGDRLRVDESGGAHLHSDAAGDQELQGILRACDPAHADEWD